MMYRWNNDLIERFEDVKRAGSTPEYIQKHYMTNGHFDGQRLVDDFKAVMGRQSTAYSDTVLGGQGFDVGKSVKATQLFTSSFADAAMDPNNPNRADAIRFMSKILEMDSQGKGVRILSNNGQSGSYCLGRDINLALYTLDGKQVETVFHESGHMIFNSSLNAQYPSNFDAVRRRAVSNLDSAGSQTLLRLYEENADEARYYTQYLAGKKLDSAVRAQGYSGISGYRDWLTQEYSGQSASSRNATLQSRSVQGGMATGGSYKQYSQNIDFNDAQLCANMQINQMRARTADTIFRSDFGNYATTSGIIDSASQGKVRYNYGHGASYFSGKPDPTLASYHELIADYSSLKLRGDQHTIGFLRFLMGNELFDMLDGTYQQMLK